MLSFLILLSTALTLSSAWSDSEYLVSLDGVDDDNHLGKYISLAKRNKGKKFVTMKKGMVKGRKKTRRKKRSKKRKKRK